MRVTFLSPEPSLCGGQRVISIYADRLRRRGHDVVVVATPPPRPGLRASLKSMAAGQGWPRAREVGASHLVAPGIDLRVLDRARPIADADVPDADVVVATWWETAEWAGRLAPRKGKKAYFIQHHEVFPYLPVDRVERTWKMPMHKVVISGWLAELSRQKYGEHDFSLVPNSVDHEQFRAPPRGKNPVPTVGLLYSHVPFKGCDVALKAFEICAREVPGLRLVAFGTDRPSDDLPLPPAAEFTFSPRQDALRDLYSACDVWLCGSRSEGFHLPPSEAMACRCPVVSTRVGGPMDLIRDGENGYLVDVGDAEALAGRLREVLALPDAGWRAMSDAALETVRAYSWDDATDLFEAALRRCADGR